MDIRSIYNLFNKLNEDSLSFIYHGFMSDEFTANIISLSEKKIEKSDDSAAIKHKVSFLIAESFQNIIRHGIPSGESNSLINKPGIFIYRIIGNTYIISSANIIANPNISKVTEKLTHVNNLNKDQLHDLYQEIRKNTDFSEKGGAGLGLIEMARKTGNKLEYDFEKIDDQFSFFYLQLKFKSKISPEDNGYHEPPIATSMEFHDIMNKNNTYLTYKGDFSPANLLTLLKIIERNLQVNPFESESIKTQIYVLLTELLQNISKHAYSPNDRKEGIFLLGQDAGKYMLSTGNFILNDKIGSFKVFLDSLNKMSKDDLQKLYVDKIKSGDLDHFGNAGLGFIEIAKECDEITYTIFEVTKEYSFLTLRINI